MPIKRILTILTLIVFTCIGNILSAQNFELLTKDKKETEKDLWKKERLNYYLDSKELNERYPESFYYRGQEKLRKGFYKEAIADFKKAISNEDFPDSATANSEKGPSNKNAYFRISLCFQQLLQSDSALFFCQKAIDEDKYFLDAYIQKASLLSDMENYKEAIELLDAAQQIFPDSKEIYFKKAQLYLQQDKIAKAKRYLKKASDVDPDFDKANILLATIYIYDYNIDAARRILNRSINAGKKPVTSLYYRAMIYQAEQKYEKAYHDLNRAYYLDTINSPVATNLFLLDYYYENYKRAMRLGLELWTKNLTNEGILDNQIAYEQYEFGYFMKYLNDTIATQLETKTANLCFYNIVHKKNNAAKMIAKEAFEEQSNSLFLSRLSIYTEYKSGNYFQKYKEIFMLAADFTRGEVGYFMNADFSDEIEAIEQVNAVDSSILSMYWLKSFFEYSQGSMEDAIVSATEGILLDSLLLEPYQSRALSNLSLRNYPPAIADLKKLIESGNDFATYGSVLAQAYYQSGDYKMALETNTKVLASRNQNYTLLHNQALCYEMMNMPDSAIKYYTYLSNKSPINSKYTQSLARVHKNNGDFDKALKVLKEASNQKYSDFMLIIDIADLYVEMGAYENAITYYKKAYHSDRSYTYAYLGAADCYRKLGASEDALRLYDIAIGEMPEHAYSYYAKGLCLFNMGDYEQSVKTTYEAILLNDGFAAAYKLMAENYFVLKRYSVSISMGLNALKYNPGNKSIMYQLAASTLAKGNTDEAITFYRRIIDTEKEEKSEAYPKAIEMLQTMVSDNIQAEGAEQVLETVFEKGE